MACVNSRGVVLSGRNGSGVQRTDPDGTSHLLRPGPAGEPAWLDDQHILYQGADDRLHVCDADGANDAEVDARGSSPLYAGAGHWLANLQGGDGVRSSWGLNLPKAAALGMSSDGTAYVQTDYQSGEGLQAYRPMSLVPMFEYRQVYPSLGQFACLDGGRCVWLLQDGHNVLQSSGLPIPEQVAPAYGLALGDAAGTVWVAYGTQDRGWVLHPLDDASRGFTLTTGDAFGVLLSEPEPGVIEATWFSNTGEVGPMTRRLVWTRDAVPFAAAPEPAVPAVSRTVWAGWYAFEHAGIDPQGNCGLYVGPGQDGYIRTLDGRPIAQYAAAQHDSDVDELESRIHEVQQGDSIVPVLAYWTLNAQGIRVPNGADLIGVEAYPKIWESAAQFESRVRAAVARVRRAWLIAACYTSNTTNWADLKAAVAIYARLLRDCQNIEGLLVFSGNGRATGYQDHPEVQGVWRALFASIPGVPNVGVNVPDLGTTEPSDPVATPPPAARRTTTPLPLLLHRRHA